MSDWDVVCAKEIMNFPHFALVVRVAAKKLASKASDWANSFADEVK